MSADDVYKTISEPTKGSYKEKGSKFLAFAFPVSSEEDVKERLTAIRKEYHDARHHCYAYRLTPGNPVFRMNDDGEPSGTGGRPIYGQIVSNDLVNILIVVARYFGGTKLGIPGLINAYRSAAREAVANAVIINKQIVEKYVVSFDYKSMNNVMKVLKEENAAILKQESGDECRIIFSIRKNCEKKISERLLKISNVSLSLHVPS